MEKYERLDLEAKIDIANDVQAEFGPSEISEDDPAYTTAPADFSTCEDLPETADSRQPRTKVSAATVAENAGITLTTRMQGRTRSIATAVRENGTLQKPKTVPVP